MKDPKLDLDDTIPVDRFSFDIFKLNFQLETELELDVEEEAERMRLAQQNSSP